MTENDQAYQRLGMWRKNGFFCRTSGCQIMKLNAIFQKVYSIFKVKSNLWFFSEYIFLLYLVNFICMVDSILPHFFQNLLRPLCCEPDHGPIRPGGAHCTLRCPHKIMLLCQYSAGIRVTLLYFCMTWKGVPPLLSPILNGWSSTYELCWP